MLHKCLFKSRLGRLKPRSFNLWREARESRIPGFSKNRKYLDFCTLRREGGPSQGSRSFIFIFKTLPPWGKTSDEKGPYSFLIQGETGGSKDFTVVPEVEISGGKRK